MASRAYIGQYSADGKFFIAAFQDRRVRLYDTERKWRIRKDVTTRMTRWTITDTTLSPDQKFLVYSSISPTAYLVHVGGSMDLVSGMVPVSRLCTCYWPSICCAWLYSSQNSMGHLERCILCY